MPLTNSLRGSFLHPAPGFNMTFIKSQISMYLFQPSLLSNAPLPSPLLFLPCHTFPSLNLPPHYTPFLLHKVCILLSPSLEDPSSLSPHQWVLFLVSWILHILQTKPTNLPDSTLRSTNEREHVTFLGLGHLTQYEVLPLYPLICKFHNFVFLYS